MGVIMPSGTYECFNSNCGLYFFGTHSHDSVWHLAISAVSFHQIPPKFPTFIGAGLSGYNYLLDLILYGGSVLGISPLILFFKIIPIVWFVTFTAMALLFVKKVNSSSLFAALFLFLLYFCGSFSYIIRLLNEGTIIGSVALLSMQPPLMLSNLQYAISLIILLGIIVILKNGRIRWRTAFMLAFLLIVSVGYKFYAGIVCYILILSFLFVRFIKVKSQSKRLIFTYVGLFISCCFFVSILVFYDPFAPSNKAGALHFVPLATVHPLFEDPHLLSMPEIVQARYFLQEQHKFSIRLLGIESISMVMYIVLNFGVRIFGLLYVGYLCFKRKISDLDISIMFTIGVSLFLATFFVQSGVWWNTVQFLYYSMFLSTIFLAQFLYALINKTKWNMIFVIGIIVISLPSAIDVMNSFFFTKPGTYIPEAELQALQVLKTQHKDGTVYAPLYQVNNKLEHTSPFALFRNDDTAYVAAFSSHPVYYADEIQMALLNIPYKARKDKIIKGDCSFLNEIQYVYALKNIQSDPGLECVYSHADRFISFYENTDVILYKKKD